MSGPTDLGCDHDSTHRPPKAVIIVDTTPVRGNRAGRRHLSSPWAALLAGIVTMAIAGAAGCAAPADSRPSTSPPTPISTSPSARPSASDHARTPTPAGTATGPGTDGAGVRLVDDFNGPTLDASVWNTCYWWDDDGCTIVSNHELEWYRPEGVRVADGTLKLVAERGDQKAPDGTTYPFRSGMVTTGPARDGEPAKLAFTYGTVDARLRVPDGKGLWSAMWLLPASQKSRPEIDVFEILGNDPTTSIMHLHPTDRSATSPAKDVRLPGVDFSQGWHDFRLDWQPRSLTFTIDGHRVWRLTGSQVPSEPMYVIINLAVGGDYPGDPSAATHFPAVLAVDRVTISG